MLVDIGDQLTAEQAQAASQHLIDLTGHWLGAGHKVRDQNGNASTASSSIYGTAVGADYRFSPSTTAGFALAGGGTSFSVANGGSGHSDLFQAGAYLRHTVGAAYINAALAYGWQDITTNRTVTIAGVDQLQARFNANAFSGRLESGYRFVAPWNGSFWIYALCSGPVHHLRAAFLCRRRGGQDQHLRAGLWGEKRHRQPQRARLSYRQGAWAGKRGADLAQPFGLGA